MDEDKRFKHVKAVFEPDGEHAASLKPELCYLIGEEAVFCYVWLMGDDDIYPGVWALTTEDRRWLGLWVPEFDLRIL